MPKSIIFGIGPEFLQRDGLTETVAPWEDGLRAATGRGYFEWWYFDAHQRLLRLLANPYYFRFNAALELSLDLPGLQTVEKGRALYEIMLLR